MVYRIRQLVPENIKKNPQNRFDYVIQSVYNHSVKKTLFGFLFLDCLKTEIVKKKVLFH